MPIAMVQDRFPVKLFLVVINIKFRVQSIFQEISDLDESLCGKEWYKNVVEL